MSDGLTPLARRLAAVGLSVRTRWLYWCLVALVVVTCLVVAVLVHQGPTEPRLASSVPFPFTPRPEATIGAPGAGGRVAPGDAPSVAIRPALAEPQQQVFVPLAKARSVTLYAPFTAEHLRWLAAQPKLTALTLEMTDDQSITDLHPLSSSSSLRSLRVRMRNAGDGDGAPMAWPPNLELLDLQGADPLTPQRVEELRRLPHLHTLAVRLHDQHAPSALSDEMIATLQSFPALRKLYVTEAPAQLPHLVQETRRALPALQVRPSTYNDSRAWWVLILCLVVGQLVAILHMLQWPPFATPASVLLPGYRTPHVAVGVTLFAVGLGTVAGLLRFAGADWLTACALCGGAATMFALMPFDVETPGFTRPRLFLFLEVRVFLMALLGVIALEELDWFLRGERPWISAALILSGVLLVTYTVKRLPTAYRRIEERGRGGSPLGLDPVAWQAWAATTRPNVIRQLMEAQAGKGPDETGKLPAVGQRRATGFDRRMNAAAPCAPGDPEGRRRLWVAGAAVTSRFLMACTLVACALFSGCLHVAGYVTGNDPPSSGALVLVPFGFTVVLLICLPAAVAYGRRPFHAMELLWPVSRADWVRDWFVMSARDISLAMLLAAVGAFGGWWFNLWLAPPLADWLPWGLLLVGSAVTLRAAELWLRTFAITWQPALAFPAIVAGAGISGFAVQRLDVGIFVSGLPGLWTLAAVSLLVGAGVTYIAHRRWMTWQLG